MEYLCGDIFALKRGRVPEPLVWRRGSAVSFVAERKHCSTRRQEVSIGDLAT